VRTSPRRFSETNLAGANLFEANLSEADLSEAQLAFANLFGANLAGANLVEAGLVATDFTRAQLAGADLSGVALTEANLTGADLTGAVLYGVNLDRTNFTGADLTSCHVYGISVWNVNLEGAKQKNLIITDNDEPDITVDNLEVAQFIYLLLKNEKIRDIIDTITTKAVLILGRFTPERKAVLDALREELRKRDRTPIVFDFDQPESKNVTDTVKLLAQLVRYIIVDLSDPNSAPYELGVISMLGLDSTPVVPLIASGQRPFPMLDDVLRKRWSTQLVRYQDLDDIRANLDEMLIKIAEAKVQELRAVSPPTA
jgi:Pentapeptide repeats (8 copies)